MARAALLQQYLLHLLHLHLSLTSVTMSEWVVLDITSMTKTTKSDKVIKILKEVSKNYFFSVNLQLLLIFQNDKCNIFFLIDVLPIKDVH